VDNKVTLEWVSWLAIAYAVSNIPQFATFGVGRIRINFSLRKSRMRRLSLAACSLAFVLERKSRIRVIGSH
jgi:hypothetical protein